MHLRNYSTFFRQGEEILHFWGISKRDVTFLRVIGRAAGLSSEVRQSSDTDHCRTKQNAKERNNSLHGQLNRFDGHRRRKCVVQATFIGGKISNLRQRHF